MFSDEHKQTTRMSSKLSWNVMATLKPVFFYNPGKGEVYLLGNWIYRDMVTEEKKSLTSLTSASPLNIRILYLLFFQMIKDLS